jgi:hypothetical protein
LIIFGMGSISRAMFRPVRYNLAEIYVVATYAYATIGIEVVYITYAVSGFAQLKLFRSLLRVAAVLAVGYGLPTAIVGAERAVVLVLPPMPAPN